MNTIVLELKNPAKRDLLLAILAELDFVKVKEKATAEHPDVAEVKETNDSLFDLVGIWADREIDGDSLRSAAWKR